LFWLWRWEGDTCGVILLTRSIVTSTIMLTTTNLLLTLPTFTYCSEHTGSNYWPFDVDIIRITIICWRRQLLPCDNCSIIERFIRTLLIVNYHYWRYWFDTLLLMLMTWYHCYYSPFIPLFIILPYLGIFCSFTLLLRSVDVVLTLRCLFVVTLLGTYITILLLFGDACYRLFVERLLTFVVGRLPLFDGWAVVPCLERYPHCVDYLPVVWRWRCCLFWFRTIRGASLI